MTIQTSNYEAKKAGKGEEWLIFLFLLCWNILAARRGILFEPLGVHIPLSTRERGALAGGPDARLERPSPSLPVFLSALATEAIEKKKLVKSHTAFRSDFYPV